MARALYFPEVVADTGISERNVKFYMAQYALVTGKEGRNTTFPPETVEELCLIRDLVATQLVTSRMILVILKTRRNVALSEEENRALQRLAELWLTAPPAVSGPAAAGALPVPRRAARPSSPDGII